MALDDVVGVFSRVANLLYSKSLGVSNIFAWIGIILISIVVGYYIVFGIVKAIKMFLNMKIKYIGVITLMLGLIFITLAILLP
jgi:predicted transporter